MSRDIRSRRSERMLDDVELTGDLLLVGLCFARLLDFGGIPVGEKLNTRHVAHAAFGPGQLSQHRVKGTLAGDARRYESPHLTWQDKRCGAPMIRRVGTCGQPSKWTRLVTDWTTGEKWWLLACQRHVQWYDDTARANREARPDIVPRPFANSGGVLARHIPEFGWPKVWTWATNNRWEEFPEASPRAKPTLSLVFGDGDDGPRSGGLSVVGDL